MGSTISGCRNGVALVIPAYRAEAHISDMLDSAASQTPGFKKIVVVDDGSPIDIETVVRCRGADEKLNVLRQPHLGQGPARNLGINYVDEEFVMFADSDDRLTGTLLADFEMAVRQHPALDLFCFSASVVSVGSEPIGNAGRYNRGPDRYFGDGRRALTHMLRSKRFIASPCLYILRRSLLDTAPVLRFPAMKHEDEVFTLQLFLRSGCCLFSTNSYYERRVRPESIMTSKVDASNVEGYFRAAGEWLKAATYFQAADASLLLRYADGLYTKGLAMAADSNLPRTTIIDYVDSFCSDYVPAIDRDYRMLKIARRLPAFFYQTFGRRPPL